MSIIDVTLIILNVATFFMYWWDKRAARRGGWRTSENTLLLMGLAGGWPAAVIAQHTFRHKTIKSSFRYLFWVSVVLNLIIYFTLTGA